MQYTLSNIQNMVSLMAKKDTTALRSQIVEWMNDAIVKIMTRGLYKFEWLKYNTTLTYSTGEYRKALPTGFKDFVETTSVYNETDELFMDIKVWKDFVKLQGHVVPNTTAPSSSDYGTPNICSILFEDDEVGLEVDKYLYINPPADSSTVLRIHYWKEPTKLDETTHTSTVIETLWGCPSEVVLACINYCIYQLRVYKGDDAMINQSQMEWLDSLNGLLQVADNNDNTTPTVNVRW